MSNQILHIFRKDVRHLWREILLSFAIVVAYARNQVSRSLISSFTPYEFSFLSEILPLLVVVAWAFLIIRTVQDESLVGDRQFWVTRPYEWKKLLAAKVLFALVFVNVPLFILQVFLLLKAGFPPTSYIRGLLLLQMGWAFMLIWPVETLSTVTASIGQFLLGLLGVVLYLYAVASLFSFVPAAGVGGAGTLPASLGLLVVIGTSLAVVLLQYARRRTGRSRLLLVAAAAAVPIFMFVAPYPTLIAHFYPRPSAGKQLPVQLASDPAKPASPEGGYPEKNKVHLQIPLLVSGVENGWKANVDGMIESIQTNEGLRWNSGWHGYSLVFHANRERAQLRITLDRDFFERVKSSPVKVHISFALTPTHARETIRVVVRPGQFTMPGDGRCWFSPISPGDIDCLFPPTFSELQVSARSEEITCAPRGKETPLSAGTVGYGLITSVPLGINPVHLEPLQLWDWGEFATADSLRRVCPGTPLTVFTNWKDSQRTRGELDIDGIRLIDYQLNDSPSGSGTLSIRVP